MEQSDKDIENDFDDDPFPTRECDPNGDEYPHILVKNKITKKEYRIEGDDNGNDVIIGPSGPWKSHLRWLLFKGLLKYKGPSSGAPILYQADEIHSSKFWEVLLVVTSPYRPGVHY